MAYQVILGALGYLFRGDDCPEMDDLLGEAVLEFGVPSSNSVGILKDKGNMFFKMGNVPLAYFHYKIALKFLLLMGPLAICDASSATSLALSLFLNLAACDLKVSDYEQACWYCNLILYVEPSNIKALYRRGLAFKHLNLLPKAVADFECALKFNPNNKDISRELQVVVDLLTINSNGKRESPKIDPLGIERKGKKPLLSSASFDDCVPVNLPEVPMDLESNHASDAAVNETVCSASSNSSQFTFSSKKKPYNKLSLSSEDYDNLIHGKVLGFYHPRSMSFMRVRPLISKTIQTGTLLEDISGTAEVPTSSPISENLNTIFNVKQAESVEQVSEGVVFQVDKKKRLSFVSSHASKVSVTKYQFAATGNQLKEQMETQ